MQELQIKIAELRTDGVISSTEHSQLDYQILNADVIEFQEIKETVSEIEKNFWK